MIQNVTCLLRFGALRRSSPEGTETVGLPADRSRTVKTQTAVAGGRDGRTSNIILVNITRSFPNGADLNRAGYQAVSA